MHTFELELSLIQIPSSPEKQEILNRLSTASVQILTRIKTFESGIGTFAEEIQKFLKDVKATLPPKPITPNIYMPGEEVVQYQTILVTLKELTKHTDIEGITELIICIVSHVPGLANMTKKSNKSASNPQN